jgi:hypothetical protein
MIADKRSGFMLTSGIYQQGSGKSLQNGECHTSSQASVAYRRYLLDLLPLPQGTLLLGWTDWEVPLIINVFDTAVSGLAIAVQDITRQKQFTQNLIVSILKTTHPQPVSIRYCWRSVVNLIQNKAVHRPRILQSISQESRSALMMTTDSEQGALLYLPALVARSMIDNAEDSSTFEVGEIVILTGDTAFTLVIAADEWSNAVRQEFLNHNFALVTLNANENRVNSPLQLETALDRFGFIHPQ